MPPVLGFEAFPRACPPLETVGYDLSSLTGLATRKKQIIALNDPPRCKDPTPNSRNMQDRLLAAVAEEHYVAFLHNVFLAFEAHLRALAGHAQASGG